MNKSITIIGRISSGKSTLAKSVQELIPNSRIISFGGYLKDYSEKQNWSYDRKSLQDLGQRFIDQNPNEFLKDIVDFNQVQEGEILIFEGIRHKSIIEAIQIYYPVLVSAYLEVDVRTRYDRYLARSKNIDIRISWEEFLKSDLHKVELEIESLKDICDVILMDSSLDSNVEMIIKSISS